MWSNLNGDSVAGHLREGLLEEHGADQVVDEVGARGVLCQRRVPLLFRDGGADPAGTALLGIGDSL